MHNYLHIKYFLSIVLQMIVICFITVCLSVNNTYCQNILSNKLITTPKTVIPAATSFEVATVCQTLGSVQNFIFFSSIGAVSNIGISTITGDVGSNLGAVSGFNPTSILAGGIFSGTAYTIQAKKDLLKLYIHLSNIPVTNSMHAPAFGSNETIMPGVYTIQAAGSMAGNLTLDARGNANAIFIIKFDGAFSPAAGSSIILTNLANASNVYFIAEGAISIGTNSTLKGTFIAHTGAVSMAAGGNLEGRLLSTVGAVVFGPGKATLPAALGNLPALNVGNCNNTLLNSAGNFTLFTSAGAVSNIGASGIIGNVGSNAGAVSGFETSATTLMGNISNADGVTKQAAKDLLAGYTTLLNFTTTNGAHGPVFGNENLRPGVYTLNAAGSLAGSLTLDGTGFTDPIFIFRFGGALTVAAQSKIILRNVSHCNVFWVAEGAITIGALSFMKGNFIANNGANTMGANGNLEGSLYSTAGAIGFNTGVGYISFINCTTISAVYGSARLGKIANTINLNRNLSIENKLAVYPNPVRGIVNLQLTGDPNMVTGVEIADVLGKVIYSSKQYQPIINLSNSATGIYFVRVHLNSTIITTKIILAK